MKLKTSLGALAPCSSTGSRKRKSNAEEREPSLCLVACTRKGEAGGEPEPEPSLNLVDCTSKGEGGGGPEPEPNLHLVACTSKGKGVEADGESAPPGMDVGAVDKIEDEEWEHIWSESSDDDRSSLNRTETFEDFVWAQGIDLDYFDYLEPGKRYDVWCLYRYGRIFRITDKKRDKFARQNKKKVELSVLVNRRPDLTHESSADDVFEKLKKEGLISMPKNFALPLIMGAISRRESFHRLELRFNLVKMLVTAVPCIKPDADSDRVIKLFHRAGLACDFPDHFFDSAFIVLDGIFKMGELQWYHPVIRKERIKWTLAKIERKYKKTLRQLIQKWNRDVPEPYADYIKQIEEEYKSSKIYVDALKVVQLHQEFHKHVAFCDFITHDMKIRELMKDKRVVETRFEGLDRSLIKATLKAMLSLLKADYEFQIFEAWVQGLVEERVKKGRSSMDEILDTIRAEHPNFPRLPDKWTFTNLKRLPLHWTTDQMQDEISSFYELLHKVKEHTNCQVSHAYLLEGILRYLCFCSWFDEDPREWTVEDDGHIYHCCPDLPDDMEKAWDEAFYDHPAYRIVYEDVSTLLC